MAFLKMEDVQVVDVPGGGEAVHLRLTQTKTEGTKVKHLFLPGCPQPEHQWLCPVRHLRLFLARLRIVGSRSPYLFQRFRRGRIVNVPTRGRKAGSRRVWRRIVYTTCVTWLRRMLQAAFPTAPPEDIKRFTFHSPRRGGATQGAKSGGSHFDIMRAGRWRSLECAQEYVDEDVSSQCLLRAELLLGLAR